MKVFSERTPVKQDDLFVILDSVNKGFDYPIHNHPEYELTLVRGSAGNRIVGDSRSRYANVDLVLLGPYLFHKWDDKEKSGTDEDPCRVITIQFDHYLFDRGLLSRNIFKNISELLHLSGRGICFRGKTRDRAARRIEALTEKKGFESATCFLGLMNYLASSGDYELLASEEYKDASQQTRSERMQMINQYLIEHFQDPKLKLSDVAEVVNLSDSAFGHFFKKATGKSYSAFLIELRLRNARNLLLETDEQVSAICIQSGFNNHSNFNRLFKKKYGSTPLQFRKKFQQDSEFDWNSQKAPGQFVPIRESARTSKKPEEYATRIVHL